MPSRIKFHLDENCNVAIAAGLRRRGIDVTTTEQTRLKSAPDEQHVTFALSDVRTIVTQDPDFLRMHAQGVTHPGIVFFKQNARSVGEVIPGIILIWEVLTPDEMWGHVEFL